VLSKIHLPLLRPAVLSGLLLVFIDVMKELPATLILRPFNFETLATRVYRLAADERLGEASTAALSIILLSLVPTVLIVFTKLVDNSDRNLG
jgi:iron(III) transport system permease protein